MLMEHNHETKALFKSVTRDGTCWLFLVSPERWVIMREGSPIAVGAGTHRSLTAGLDKYLSLVGVGVDPCQRKRDAELV